LPAGQIIVQAGLLEFVWYWRYPTRGAAGTRNTRPRAHGLERGKIAGVRGVKEDQNTRAQA
jgi:hypothetical protein